MARLNVYVGDELAEQIKERLPGVNVSAVLQQALKALIDCDHGQVACVDCGEVVNPAVAAGEVLGGFWSELLWAWQPLVDKRGTAEGAARVAREVAVKYGVPRADKTPLPRPPRLDRRAS